MLNTMRTSSEIEGDFFLHETGWVKSVVCFEHVAESFGGGKRNRGDPKRTRISNGKYQNNSVVVHEVKSKDRETLLAIAPI